MRAVLARRHAPLAPRPHRTREFPVQPSIRLIDRFPNKALPSLSLCQVLCVADAAISLGLIVPALRARALANLRNLTRLDNADAPSYGPWVSSASSGSQGTTRAFFVFNCTNAGEVLLGAAPAMQAVGPFVLTQGHLMHDVEWEAGGDLISFKKWEWLLPGGADCFDGGGAGGGCGSASLTLPLTTVVQTLNFPLIVLVAHGYPLLGEEARRGTHADSGAARGAAPGVRVPDRVRRIIAGRCDGTESNGLSDAHSGRPLRAGELADSLGTDARAADAQLIVDEYGCRLSAPAAAAAARLRLIVHDTMRGEGPASAPLFLALSAQEVLFGYKEEIFSALHAVDPSFPAIYPGLVGNVTSLEENEATGVTRMYTGLVTPELARSLTTWDGMNSLLCCAAGPCGPAGPSGSGWHPAWGTVGANAVTGSDGHRFRGDLGAGDSVELFLDAFARSVRLAAVLTPQSDSLRGISTVRYEIDPGVFASSASDPENAAYFAPAKLDGLMNLTSCAVGGAPVFVSKPFFLGGNASLNANVSLPFGRPEQHDTWFEIEPRTGVVMEDFRRFQMNVYVDQADIVTHAAELAGGRPRLRAGVHSLGLGAPFYMPLYWGEEHSSVSSQWVTFFKSNVLEVEAFADLVYIGGVGSASALGALAALLIALSSWRRRVFLASQWDGRLASLMAPRGDLLQGALLLGEEAAAES